MSCANVNGVIRDNQDALTITLDTCIDLTTDVSSVAIVWRDPTGLTGEWVGTVADTTKISYDLSVGQFLTPKGTWSFISKVVFTDGSQASGSTVSERVHGAFA